MMPLPGASTITNRPDVQSGEASKRAFARKVHEESETEATMNQPSLHKLDLNLLIALDRLLVERHVTRAARAIPMSQPAMSSALRRLRRHFDDELLTRRGRALELTPLARHMSPLVRNAVRAVEQVFDTDPEFDPAKAEMDLTLVCSDYVASFFMPVLLRKMTEYSPRCSVRVLPYEERSSAAEMEDALYRVDGFVVSHGWIVGYPSLDLLSDEWVLIAAATDPTTFLSSDDLQRRPWVVASLGQDNLHMGMRQVLEAGIQPRIAVSSGSRLSIPFLVANSDRLAIVERSLLNRVGEFAGVKAMESDLIWQQFGVGMWWHPSLDHDAGHRWFRSLVQDVGTEYVQMA